MEEIRKKIRQMFRSGNMAELGKRLCHSNRIDYYVIIHESGIFSKNRMYFLDPPEVKVMIPRRDGNILKSDPYETVTITIDNNPISDRIKICKIKLCNS